MNPTASTTDETNAKRLAEMAAMTAINLARMSSMGVRGRKFGSSPTVPFLTPNCFNPHNTHWTNRVVSSDVTNAVANYEGKKFISADHWKRLGLATATKNALAGKVTNPAEVSQLVADIRDAVQSWRPSVFPRPDLLPWLRQLNAGKLTLPFGTVTAGQADQCWALADLLKSLQWGVVAARLLSSEHRPSFDPRALLSVLGGSWVGGGSGGYGATARSLQIMEMLAPRRRRVNVSVIASGNTAAEIPITDSITCREVVDALRANRSAQIDLWLDVGRTKRMVASAEMFVDVHPDVTSLFVDIVAPGIKSWTKRKEVAASNATFSRCGTAIVALAKGRLSVLNEDTDEVIRKVYMQEGVSARTSLPFSQHGDLVVCCGAGVVWDVRNNVRQTTLKPLWADSFDWSPDGSRIVSASARTDRIQIWDPRSGKCLMDMKLFSRPRGTIQVAWSPDGSRIVSAASQPRFTEAIKVWDAKTGRCIASFEEHSVAVSWSPNSRCLVSGQGGNIRVWDTDTGTCLRTLQTGTSYTDPVRDLAWSPCGSWIASITHSLTIYNAQTGDRVARKAMDNYGIHSRIAWHPDCSRVIVGILGAHSVIIGRPQLPEPGDTVT
jgi:hypothetical protein